MKSKSDRSRENYLAKSLLLQFLFFFLTTIIIVSIGMAIVVSTKSPLLKIVFSMLFLIVNTGVFIFIVNIAQRKVHEKIDIFLNNNARYESILDAVPFPIHVTDNNMKWTYMNKAFEALLVKNGAIKDRESSYGLPCSTAGANICGSKGCGIRQLRENRGLETYFDWYGAKCKQDTAVIKDYLGKDAGYVEVVTDLTSIISVNEYSKHEVLRLAKSIDMIANGELNIDLNVTSADKYSQDMMNLFSTINDSLKKVKQSLQTLNGETNKLVEAGKNGELTVRGNEEGLHGVFGEIINGINQTFDAIKEPLDVVSAFMNDLSAGTAETPIVNTYKGYYATLVDDTNSVLNSLLALLQESTILSEAGKRGDLSVRSDTSKLPGHYGDLVAGMNGILDAVNAPLDEVGHILKNMSHGNDFTKKATGDYQGAFKVLADSINQVIGRFNDVEKLFDMISVGDLSQLERYKKIGKRSDNDKLMPASVKMMQSLQNLVDTSTSFANVMAVGDLRVREDLTIDFQGSYRDVTNGMHNAMRAIKAPLDEAAKVLGEMAQGNLSVEVTGNYEGEYKSIKDSINQVIASFNSVLGELNTAANQVSVGSNQVAAGSQALSQGATEQASSVEELTSTIAEIAVQIKENAGNATQASHFSSEVLDRAVQGKAKMDEMLASIREIDESSASISKIIKVIDDIAFQTNILALNAAVEAARAGQYGKGFAVVAEEVRNLAAKSADAAKETTALIEGSIGKAENGTKIANETAEMLSQISQGVGQAADLVERIAAASNEQATAIAQVDQGITQVSTVVQTNSATSEESAASSEELSGQADTLMQMVKKFRLKDEDISKQAFEEKTPDINHGIQTKILTNPTRQKASQMEQSGKY